MHAANVNVSNFVSVKLSGRSNYHIWKAQMLSLLDHLMIREIVEKRQNWFESKNEYLQKEYDILLKGWILGSLNQEVLHVDYSDCAHCIWVTLSSYPTEKEMEEYMHASNVNVSNFVLVKLSGRSNYHIWKAQMLSLLDHLMIREIVEKRQIWFKSKNEYLQKEYDILLKGWILGSLNEEVLRHVDYSACAHCIWVTLSGYPTGL
nr:ankyrin repeat-containing protein [Tanacetum cinerariifolium]